MPEDMPANDFSLDQLEAAAKIVHAHMPPTPAIQWPLLSARVETDVWVKHENHTAIGAFKVRGGLVYLSRLKAAEPDLAGVITATRGNHGQSIGRAAQSLGIHAVILVPRGNNPEKNAAMRAFGVELIEHGDDFQEAYEYAAQLGAERKLHMIPPFHPWLIQGVASYGLEFLGEHRNLDAVYVPVGMGSGICAMISVRDALGLKTEIIGVVSENAPCYALSFDAGEPVSTNSANTIADGVACRTPDAAAVDIICRGAARVVKVSETEIKDAMRAYFTDTHNLAEGAGAAPLAALLKEKDTMRGRKTGVVLTGGNVDRELLGGILAEAG